jgi:hypothetical protein
MIPMENFIVGFLQGVIAVASGTLISMGFEYLFEVRYKQFQNWMLKRMGYK